MTKRWLALTTAGLAVGLSGVFASQSLAASACTASTRPLALGFVAPGNCTAQVKCTGAPCRYLVRVHVDATFAPGHPGQIKGAAKVVWGSLLPNVGPLACTASGSGRRSCDTAAVLTVGGASTTRMLCSIPGSLLPVRWVSARVTCSFARL